MEIEKQRLKKMLNKWGAKNIKESLRTPKDCVMQRLPSKVGIILRLAFSTSLMT